MTASAEAAGGHGQPTLVIDLTAYTPQTINASAELLIARTIAAAAGVCEPHDDRVVTVGFALARDGAAQGVRWSRAQVDQLSRALDRAVVRIHPALDPLQYLSASSPRFTHTPCDQGTQSTSASLLLFVLEVRPSVCFWRGLPCMPRRHERVSAAPHTVEGEQVAGLAQFASLPDVPVLTNHTQTPTSDAVQPVKTSDGSTAVDAALWRRARAARAAHLQHEQQQQTALADGTSRTRERCEADSQCSSNSSGRAQSEEDEEEHDVSESVRQVRCVRLARWLAERFVNEASWARPASSSPAHVHRGKARHVPPAQRPARDAAPRHTSVLEAAAAAAFDTTNARRYVHADGCGMELEAMVIGYTARYVYLAVPTSISTTQATTRYCMNAPARTEDAWYMVCRLPHSARLAVTTRAMTTRAAYAVSHKRPREAAASEEEGKSNNSSSSNYHHNTCAPPFSFSSSSHAVLYNQAEVMLHDTSSPLVVLEAAARRPVLVRAYRVYCQGIATPRRAQNFIAPPPSLSFMPAASNMSLCFDDVYLLASPHQTAAPSLSGECYSFEDCLALVQRSCARYLARGAKWRHAALHHGIHGAPKEEEEEEKKITTATATRSSRQSVTKREMCARAAKLYDALTDTVSVHFGKLRGRTANKAHALSSLARSNADMPVPVVSTCRDIAALHEGCTVEFKYKLGANTSHRDGGKANTRSTNNNNNTIIMSVERIRHTIAAMASMYGGVIVIGVDDAAAAIVGHEAGLVLSQLRASGFCPAMVKDSVTVKELRVLHTASVEQKSEGYAVHGCAPVSSAGTAAGSNNNNNNNNKSNTMSKMPANWWKQGAQTGTGAATPEASASRVVTVVTVRRGQAPFYTSSRQTLPYVRGCASTTPMPMAVMTMRIALALYHE